MTEVLTCKQVVDSIIAEAEDLIEAGLPALTVPRVRVGEDSA